MTQSTRRRMVSTRLLGALLVTACLLSLLAGTAAEGVTRPYAALHPQLSPSQSTSSVRHPLDPLTVEEYEATVDILRAANKVDDHSRFPLVTLHEPAKDWVLDWRPNMHIPRAAFAIVKQGPKTFEALVSLTQRRLVSWREVPGVQPGVLFEEFIGAQEVALQDEEFQAALARRGLSYDGDNLFCAPLTVGYFNLPEEEGKRLLRVPCFYIEGSSTHLFAQPIEGLHAVVDLNTKEVLKVVDSGVRPLPPNKAEFSEEDVGELREPLKPVLISQPLGSNVKVEGHTVTWDNWSFHQRLDKRTGLVISRIRYGKGDDARDIMYQGSLSEVFVPYMDPDVGWYWRTFMDAGEYGFGVFATPLTPGVDCPDNATFLGGVLPDDFGNPYPAENVICIFERNTGDPLWRHFETYNGVYEGRPAIELVTRMIATVGNYDYLVDWVFTQDGRIRVRVGATGIDISKGVYSAHMDDDSAAQDTAYGTLVAPNVVAPNHDHYFSFRLDMDVDGRKNSFELAELVPVMPEDSPRKSLWQVRSRTLQSEAEARLHYDPLMPAKWEIINESKESSLGHHRGYELRPLNSAVRNIMSAEDYPTKRAAFTLYNLWVTPYNSAEYYAAGVYPNQSKGGDGLPEWTAQDRSIENTDIVLWYTAGLHHNPHQEDWPVMSVVWLEFELVPHNFFDRNPSLDVPEQP